MILDKAGVAAVLSCVFSGLGQIYNGQIVKGLAVIFFSVCSIVVFLIGGALLGFWVIGKIFFLPKIPNR